VRAFDSHPMNTARTAAARPCTSRHTWLGRSGVAESFELSVQLRGLQHDARVLRERRSGGACLSGERERLCQTGATT
jgi:hypothetical protein